jgi:pimeloyl-ACP methyl ester carboxylesterase
MNETGPAISPPSSAAFRRSAALAFALLAALVTVSLIATDAPAKKPSSKPRVGPKGAKFYDPPRKLLPKGHGKLVWQRQATKLAPIAGAKKNRTIVYTSKSPEGKLIPVSGSVSVPKGKAPKGGWPVITYAHGTTGVADSCAPTRATANSPVAPYVTYVDPQLSDWIKAGYAVVRTDYPGLGTPGPHPYLVGISEGRSVLDVAAASRQLDPSIGKRYLIAGHSQGGQAALFAASLAKKWAPKLRLRGTVSYAPASHLKEQAQLLPALTSPSPLSALVMLILEGATTTSKAIKPKALLTPPALTLYPQVDSFCLPELGEPDSFGGLAPSSLLEKGADTGPLFAALEAMNPALEIDGPILLAQGLADTTVLPAFTDLLNGQLVQLGDSVQYDTYPGVTHPEIVAAAEEKVMTFFQKRLPAKP